MIFKFYPTANFFLILLSLSSISCKLNISFFAHIPYAGFPYSNDELGPALDLAITDLSKYYNGTEIVIHYSAQIFPGLYMCDQSMAVIAQLSAQYYFSDVKTHEQTVFVFFVAGCVELMVFAADFARDANSMFVLSMGTQGTLNDEIRFPTVIRFVPYQAANIADCYFGILQYFMWFHSSLFTEMALPLYDEVARALITKFRWSRKFLNIAFNFCETTLVEDLKLAARSSRIMLLAVPMYRVRQILVAAQKLGFVNGDFVYIAAWPYEHAQYGNLSWQYGDADDQVARSAFGSLLVITPKITSTELRICDMYKVILPNSKKNPLVLATYLSFIATAKVIASAWTNGKNVKNATALVRDLRSPSYAQEPIMVLLKAALYSILRFDEGSLSLRDVYSYNPSNKEWEPTPGAVPKWPRPTNEPPPDEPYCGFMNEKPWCQQSRSSSPEISSVISILVLLLMSVISFTPLRIYRRNRKANSIDRWILDAADLIPTRNSGTSPRLSCSSRNSTQQVASENSSAYPYMYYI